MNITVGSTSSHKIAAVCEACERLELGAVVSGVKTSSGQNEQPVGFVETFGGALNRANQAAEYYPEGVSIGIESGIFRFGEITLDMAIIVVITAEKRQIVTNSQGIQFPEKCVKIAEELGFETTTVGEIITQQLGGDPTDPHATLTYGIVTRTMTLVDALVTALRQL